MPHEIAPLFPNLDVLLCITDCGSGEIITVAERNKLASLTDNNRGHYPTQAALELAWPTAPPGSYATVEATDTVWVWDNDGMSWVDTGASSTGDMLKATYDPTNIAGDAFDMDNMVEGAINLILTAAERANLANQSGTNTGDQTALTTAFTPDGDIAASNVQAAIVEVRDDTDAKLLLKANVTHSHIIADVTGLQTALDDKADASHTHTASDVTDFDTEVGNQTDVAANTAARHTHANKTILDNVEVAFTNSINADVTANTAARHTHANKAVLDLITSAGSGSIITGAERTNLSNQSGTNTGDQDASTLGYTPADVTDWDGGVDPGNTNDALDQLAERVTDSVSGVSSVHGRTGAVVAAASDYDADQVDYDNSASSLVAVNVQDAIDETEARVDALESATTGETRTKDSAFVYYSGLVTDTAGTIKIPGTSGVIQGRTVDTTHDVLLADVYAEVTTVVAPPAVDGDLTIRYALGAATAGGYYGAAFQDVNLYDLRALRYVNNVGTNITDGSPTFTSDTVFGKPATRVSLLGAGEWATYLESAGVGGVGYNQSALDVGFALPFVVDTVNAGRTDIMMIAFGGSGGTFNSRKFAWLYIENDKIIYEDVDDVPVVIGNHVAGTPYMFVRTADSGGNVTNYYLNGLKVATGAYQNLWASNANLQLFGSPNTHSSDGWVNRTARALRDGAIGQLVGFDNFLSDDEVLAHFIDQTPETSAKDYSYGGIYDVVTANDSGDTVVARRADADESAEFVKGMRVPVETDNLQFYQTSESSPALGTGIISFAQGAVASHTHTASDITDFDTEVSNNASVAANTAKISATGNELEASDIDTLAELNAIVTDATLIDTGDSRLSDARTPLAHTHLSADVTDLDASVVPYTPSVLTDWDGDADPGDTDDALDQLASRVTANEGAMPRVVYASLSLSSSSGVTIGPLFGDTTGFSKNVGDDELTFPAGNWFVEATYRRVEGTLGNGGNLNADAALLDQVDEYSFAEVTTTTPSFDELAVADGYMLGRKVGAGTVVFSRTGGTTGDQNEGYIKITEVS